MVVATRRDHFNLACGCQCFLHPDVPPLVIGFFFGGGCLCWFTNAAVAAAFFALTVDFINFGDMSAREEAR
jgi:hypothetical protein